MESRSQNPEFRINPENFHSRPQVKHSTSDYLDEQDCFLHSCPQNVDPDHRSRKTLRFLWSSIATSPSSSCSTSSPPCLP